jgi:hypothetical protein
MHPQNNTDARHVVFQSSQRSTYSIFHQPFSRHKFCDFDQVFINVSSLKIICDNWSTCTVQCNFRRQNPTRRWRLTWEIVIFLDTALRLYPSRNSLLQTVLDETLQPVLWLNLAVTSFRVCRLFVFTLRKRILSSRGVIFHLPPLPGKCSMFPLSLIRFKHFWIVLLLSYSVFYSSKNLHLTNLELFLSARW